MCEEKLTTLGHHHVTSHAAGVRTARPAANLAVGGLFGACGGDDVFDRLEQLIEPERLV
jgi:hypothetical protein